MPLTYLDSSALVKRYVPEVGSGLVTRLCSTEPVVTSIIAIPEVGSALARRAREGTLTEQQRDLLFKLFLRDGRAFVMVDLNRTMAQQAALLLLTAPAHVRLRTLDALHVVSAQWAFARARRRGLAVGAFVTADRALVDAARWAGLTPVDPENYS